MPLYTPEEVAERVKRLNDLIAKEYELKEFLVSLQIRGNREHTVKAREQHDDAIKEIDRLRSEEMMPLAKDLWEFIQEAQKFLGRKELVPPELKKLENQVKKFEVKAKRC